MALTVFDDDERMNSRSSTTHTISPTKGEKEGPTAAGMDVCGLFSTTNLEEHDSKNRGDEACERKNLPGKEEEEEGQSRKVPSQVGAGLLFGLSGLALGGPILCLLAGGGAAYVASDDEGPAGEAARASGDFAVAAGSKVGEAARETDEKHGIVEKIKNAFACGWSGVRRFDEEHKATEKVKDTMSDVGQKTVEFEKKHHVGENILEGIQNGVNFLLVKLRDTTGKNSCNGNNSS